MAFAMYIKRDQEAQREFLRLIAHHGGQMATTRLLREKGVVISDHALNSIVRMERYPRGRFQRAKRDSLLPVLQAAVEEFHFGLDDLEKLVEHCFGHASLARQLNVSRGYLRDVRKGLSHMPWEMRKKCKALLAAPGRDCRNPKMRNTLKGDDHGRYQIYRPGAWRDGASD